SGTDIVVKSSAGPQVQSLPWNETSKRSGALAMKVGCMGIFDTWGMRHAVTVLQLDECEVTQV
ncbi:unnamed protein product, partial [Discosporangium mesarthrocarpum]